MGWVKQLLPRRSLRLEAVKRSARDWHRCKVLPKRWIFEHTCGWLAKFRRLAKDSAYRPANSEAVMLIAATRLRLARLA